MDTIVSAYISNQNKDLIFDDMVIKHIIYGQCNINLNSICLYLYTKIYTKRFPKSLQKTTE